MDLLSNRADQVLNKALDGLVARHQALSSNIANIDTPGYKPVRVSFESELRNALDKEDSQEGTPQGLFVNNFPLINGTLEMKTTDERHYGAKRIPMADVALNSYQDSQISYRNDENATDVDTEMTDLAKNTLQYEAIVNLKSKNSGIMKEVIKSAGGI